MRTNDFIKELEVLGWQTIGHMCYYTIGYGKARATYHISVMDFENNIYYAKNMTTSVRKELERRLWKEIQPNIEVMSKEFTSCEVCKEVSSKNHFNR
jgi:hypothetical protein